MYRKILDKASSIATLPWERIQDEVEVRHPRVADGDLTAFTSAARYRLKVPGGWLLRGEGGEFSFYLDPKHEWK